MDYGKTYENYYSKYYDKLELFAKDFFIKNHTEGITFNYTHNEFSAYLHNDFCSNVAYLNNEAFNNLYTLFKLRASIYPIDYNQKIFENKIKPEFDKIDIEQLPESYNFFKFIEEVAFIESRNEISRLVSNNSRLLVMIFKLNRFDIFEIRYYENLPLEEYPYYKELESELYPEDKENENLGLKGNEVKDYQDKIWFKTGVKLATGEAFNLYDKYKLNRGHFSKICLELGFKESDRPYFSATIQNNDSDKNTFANKDKLQKLYKHLTENNLNFGTKFLEKYNQIVV